MLEGFLGRFRQKKGPRRPRSRQEAEKRRRLAVLALIVVALVSSISIVSYGYYDTNVKPWRQAVLKVNGTVIDMRTFVNALRLQQGYAQYYSSESEWAQSVASGLQQNELVRQGLVEFELDINDVASDEAVEAKFREELVSYDMLSENATDEEFEEACKTVRESLAKSNVSLEDYKKLTVVPSLASEALREEIGERDYPATDNYQHAQVQALQVTGTDNATLMRAKWENGKPFDTLASEAWVADSLRDLSTTDNKTVEWQAKGIGSDTFDNYTFNMPLNMLGDPVLDTESGDYWLIKVLARGPRALGDDDRDTLVGEAYSTWLQNAQSSEESEIINYLTQPGGNTKVTWAIEQAQSGAS